jgi:hypothetical protein
MGEALAAADMPNLCGIGFASGKQWAAMQEHGTHHRLGL